MNKEEILEIAEVMFNNGDAELAIEGVKIIRETEDESDKACLLSNGEKVN